MRSEFFTICVFLMSYSAFGQINYFSGDIDYWNEKPPTKEPTKAATPHADVTKTENEKPVSDKFDWKPYLDAKTTEFFKEGDYTPPAPFMEIVRNPSDENIKNWFLYIDQRNQLARRLQDRMSAYLLQEGLTTPPEEKQTLKTRLASLPSESDEQKRFRFRFYFDSDCPHCRHMFSTITELERRGFLVEARQIDGKPARDLPFASIPASPDEIKRQSIRSVPLLLIGDLQKQTVYTLTGYQSVENVLEALHQRRSK